MEFECKKCILMKCLTCEYGNTCTKNIIEGTVACEIHKLSCAVYTIVEETKHIAPSWIVRLFTWKK